jgi:hypothetical protein
MVRTGVHATPPIAKEKNSYTRTRRMRSDACEIAV